MKSFEELANAALDGIASPEDRAALNALIARDPAARERFRTLELAVRSLGRVREVEAPADLKDQILDAVRSEAPPWSASAPRVVRGRGPSLSDLISRALGLRLAAAFAAGLAVGAIAFTIATGGRPLVQGPASGTMAPQSAPTGLALAAGEAQAAIEMTTRGDLVSLRVTAKTSEPAIVEITWPEGLSFVGFEGSVTGADRLHTEGSQAVLRFAGPTFEGALRLRGGPRPSEIMVRLRANHDVDEDTVTVPSAGAGS